MKPIISAASALACVALTATAAAQTPELSFDVQYRELDNGLRVVLAPDSSAPTVGIAVYYDVGSRNEVEGRSGFAHLFEHMMFQGSANVGKGEHFQHVNRNGGRMNGTTSEDRTNYFEVLPSERLGLGLWLEADRMLSLAITEDNFENQREVVKEERRLRVDNVPYVPGWLYFYSFAFQSFEYSHSVIGSMDDLDAAELSDVQDFFELYYAPNNAVLGLAGDFDVDEAMQQVELYFGHIGRGVEPPPVTIVEPAQTAYLEREIEDALATSDALIMGWHVPPMDHEDAAAIDLLATIAGSGQTSRLYSRLVTDDEIALEIEAYNESRRGPGVFTVWAVTRDSEPEAMRDAIREEMLGLAGTISEDELSRALEQAARSSVSRVETNLGRAMTIARDELYFGDPDRINSKLDSYAAVTVDDLNRVAATYFTAENCDALIIRVAADDDMESAGDEANTAEAL
ncbi:MAG: putative Zn-dependent peptidase [Bradymonadia bacterium]|jgi:predicted Zn-dependent peptidase